MAYNASNDVHVESVRREKVETTYEYVSILGDILGYWKEQKSNRIGADHYLHIRCDLGDYDHLYINSKRVEIPREKE